jgi:hypothetical protein
MFDKIREALCLKTEPVAVIWTDEISESTFTYKKGAKFGCMIPLVKKAAYESQPTAVGRDCSGCPGGAYHLGFTDSLGPQFRYFLSCGIPGQLEGEGFKKTPELVDALLQDKDYPHLSAPKDYCLFKPASQLKPEDQPESVFFLVKPDQLSALTVLANYDLPGNDGVTILFGSGCDSLVFYPRLESRGKKRGIIGLTDIAVRKYLAPDILSFAVPYDRGLEMEANVPGSFLELKAWQELKKRLDCQAG